MDEEKVGEPGDFGGYVLKYKNYSLLYTLSLLLSLALTNLKDLPFDNDSGFVVIESLFSFLIYKSFKLSLI